MNTAEILDTAVSVYKKSFLKQLAYSAIVGIIFFVIMFFFGFILIIVMSLALTGAFLAAYAQPATPFAAAGNALFAVAIVAALLILPLIVLWQSVSSAGHIILAKQVFYKQRVSITIEHITGVVFRVISAVTAQIILSLPFVGVVILTFRGLFLLTFDTLALYETGMTLLLTPWIVVVVIFGVGYWIFANVFALSVTVAIFEGKYFMSTIRRSWQLIKGEFWKILAVRTIWLVIVAAVGYAAQGSMTLIGIVVENFLGTVGYGMEFMIVFSLLTGLVSLIVSFATMPLDGIMQTTIYFNQRVKTEGLDMETKLEGLLNS